MDDKPLISVIVPAYNAEKFLKRCIDSICSQTFNSLEIILVCSDSADNTMELAHKLAEGNDCIRVISAGSVGVAEARNMALDNAEGEYAAFVDSDDYVETEYLETLYSAIQGADISVCGFEREGRKGNINELLGSGRSWSHDDFAAEFLCNNTVGGYLWNKLFIMKTIREHGLRFRKELSVGEDMAFIAAYTVYVMKARYINRTLYHYCMNEQSILQRMYTTGEFDRKKLSNMKSTEYVEIYLGDDTKAVRNAVAYRVVRTGMWTLYNTLKCSYYDMAVLDSIKERMRGRLWAYLRNRNSTPVEMAAAVMFYVSPRISWRVMELMMRRK